MSDFHQRGLISTLPRLNTTPLEELERQLETLAESHGTALILPCTLDDFRRPAMRSILAEIRHAHYLSQIVVSLNQATADDLPDIRAQLADHPRITLLWNDDPALQALLPEPRSGKGFNLWTALGWLILRGGCECVITHDCDILHYSRELPALLTWPLLDPALGYRFIKGYYPRHGGERGQLYGRVTRLFVGPLLRALVRVEGHSPLLDFLDSFRYPLAGEFGGRLSDLAQFSLSDAWGLEMDLLCSVHRALPPEAVAQIDLGSNYEHKHQVLEDGRADSGLTRLAADISSCLLHHLAREGMRLTPDFLQALRSAYQHSARHTLRRYRHVALLNRLHFPEDEETMLVEKFSAVLDRPLENTPVPLPAWSELMRTQPDWCAQFREILQLT
ncbi:MAG: glycosyl transferase [Chthoniobacterales bacterium]